MGPFPVGESTDQYIRKAQRMPSHALLRMSELVANTKCTDSYPYIASCFYPLHTHSVKMPKTRKWGRGGTSASTTTRCTTRPSTRAATIASSGAAGGSRTDYTSPTQVPGTQEPAVSLSDLLKPGAGARRAASPAPWWVELTSSPTPAPSAATSPSQGTG